MPVATPDPMDLPPTDTKTGDIQRWGVETEIRVLGDPWPLLSWEQINADAHDEFTARINDFRNPKNSAYAQAYSDWLLENHERFTEVLPTDLLTKTQAFNTKNHEVLA